VTLHRLIMLEDESTTILRNAGNHLPGDIPSHPRRLKSSPPLMWEPQLLPSTLILIYCSQKLVLCHTFL
jgi:hypothetical protein